MNLYILKEFYVVLAWISLELTAARLHKYVLGIKLTNESASMGCITLFDLMCALLLI